jgi:predicted TIM-barrel fold metal-dependent hydrolase
MHGHYGKAPAFPIWGGDADDLVAEMDRVGIEKLIVSHQAVLTPNVVWGNDRVLEAISRYPGRILGYATCYPVNDKLGIEEIKRCIDAGMHGIKLHNSSGIAYTAAECGPVWELADVRKLPVLLHTWGDIDKLEPVFEKYRNAPILLAHAGSEKPEMYVEYAKRYDNLHLELCFSRAPYGLVEYFVREVGAERILWGSDAPWMAFGQQIGRVIFADIPEEDKKRILVENPAKILDRS